MHDVTSIEVGIDILGMNKKLAEDNKKIFDSHQIKAIDVMGSIGSGKTLLVEKLIELLKGRGIKCAAIAGDVSGEDDYKRYKSHEIQVENINTGKDCHLNAHSIEHTVDKMALDEIDVLFIENVGNLVCPADFPLGTHKRIVIISVTEGDDMVRKHPTIFGLCDVIVINKVDLSEVVEVDPKVIIADAERISPHTKVILTDAKHGEGIEELITSLEL
ncbi:MAG: hydrogenase nickel incorporation protein HypB [Thermoplasmata archaeon]|nr:hydrogenase nickel incorporation protein HypB [Thermoplasmata archaeon]